MKNIFANIIKQYPKNTNKKTNQFYSYTMHSQLKCLVLQIVYNHYYFLSCIKFTSEIFRTFHFKNKVACLIEHQCMQMSTFDMAMEFCISGRQLPKYKFLLFDSCFFIFYTFPSSLPNIYRNVFCKIVNFRCI